MKETNLFVFSEPEDVAESLAMLIVDKINQNKKQSRSFNLAISGGNTPNMLFSMLAGEFSDKVDWGNLRLFWVDERCVDPNDSESNFGNVFKILLKNVPMPQENIFNMKSFQLNLSIVFIGLASEKRALIFFCASERENFGNLNLNLLTDSDCPGRSS